MTAIVIRRYFGDQQVHVYRAEHVDDPVTYPLLVPVHDSGGFYPERHDRDEIGEQVFASLPRVDGCPSCGQWCRRNLPTIVAPPVVTGRG